MRSLDGKSRAAVDGSTNPGQTRGPNAEFSSMSDAPSALDASGLRCPEPLMLLRQRMRQLAPGDRLQVLTTDPASVRDLSSSVAASWVTPFSSRRRLMACSPSFSSALRGAGFLAPERKPSFAHCSTAFSGRGDPTFAWRPSSLARGFGTAPAVIYFRLDYQASALHEVAHWCLAGTRRRQRGLRVLVCAPEGRDEAQQGCFFAVEAAPQALESLFCEARGALAPSVDNPGAPAPDLAPFLAAQDRHCRRWQVKGSAPGCALPRRPSCP